MTERLLSHFLTETSRTGGRATENDVTLHSELHRLVGLHSTTGATIREYFKQQQQQQSSASSLVLQSTSIAWQIPGTGISPLHIAVFRNSYHVVSVLQALLEINPSLKEMKMMDGYLPLHIYLQYAMTMDRSVLELLLSKENRLQPNGHGDRPMTLLYHNVLRFQWARNWELYDIPPSTNHQSWMTIIAPHQFLEYALLLLQTKDLYQICQSPECPPLLLRIICMGLDDGQGNTRVWQQYPFLLHAAAQASASCRPPRWHEGTLWPTLISYLLQQQQEQQQQMAMDKRDDLQQRLPMHYALENSTNVPDMKRLVAVSYEEMDPVTQLSPALLYASRQDTDLDWLYELVRSYPMVCVSS